MESGSKEDTAANLARAIGAEENEAVSCGAQGWGTCPSALWYDGTLALRRELMTLGMENLSLCPEVKSLREGSLSPRLVLSRTRKGNAVPPPYAVVHSRGEPDPPLCGVVHSGGDLCLRLVVMRSGVGNPPVLACTWVENGPSAVYKRGGHALHPIVDVHAPPPRGLPRGVPTLPPDGAGGVLPPPLPYGRPQRPPPPPPPCRVPCGVACPPHLGPGGRAGCASYTRPANMQSRREGIVRHPSDP